MAAALEILGNTVKALLHEGAGAGASAAAAKLATEATQDVANAAKSGLLPHRLYLQKFDEMQRATVEVTENVARSVRSGDTELQIANRLEQQLAAKSLPDKWYPTLVNAGENSGKALSRRFHMPSEAKIRDSDIVIVDSTPIHGTTWGNWTTTVAVGKDPFYKGLVNDSEELAQASYDYATKRARTVGDIFDFSNNLMKRMKLTSIDPRNDVGHSIFQVPAGQTVELTPMSQRLFISEDFRNSPIRGIVSIEPNVGRINPADGITYGAKHQRVIIRD